MLMEQNELLQERVLSLETMIAEQRATTDALKVQNKLLEEKFVASESIKEDGAAAMAKRVGVLEEKLDALGGSVEQIKSALTAWALKK